MMMMMATHLSWSFFFLFLPLFISPLFSLLLHSFNPPQRRQLFFSSLFSLSSYAHILHLRPGGPQGATTQTRLLALHTPALRVFQGSLVVVVRPPTLGRNDGWFLLPGWLGLYISYYNLHRPENYFYFLLRPAFSAAGVLLRAFDIITWKGLQSFCCQFFSPSSYTLNWERERETRVVLLCYLELLFLIVLSVLFAARSLGETNRQDVQYVVDIRLCLPERNEGKGSTRVPAAGKWREEEKKKKMFWLAIDRCVSFTWL